MLIICSPILFLTSVLIFIEDGFPVILKQKRIGINQTYFTMYKFRSMIKDTPAIATHQLQNPTSHILKIGRFLRKSSIDELPNLVNILKGDMGFVGPRPALYNQDDLMLLRTRAGIEKLLPGLTGWAQINGRDEISLKEKIAFDNEYLKRKSICFDIKIIFLTLSKIYSKTEISH